jgi:hypothetical protein
MDGIALQYRTEKKLKGLQHLQQGYAIGLILE